MKPHFLLGPFKSVYLQVVNLKIVLPIIQNIQFNKIAIGMVNNFTHSD